MIPHQLYQKARNFVRSDRDRIDRTREPMGARRKISETGNDATFDKQQTMFQSGRRLIERRRIERAGALLHFFPSLFTYHSIGRFIR